MPLSEEVMRGGGPVCAALGAVAPRTPAGTHVPPTHLAAPLRDNPLLNKQVKTCG
ncbi:hypothetical protein JYU34_013562 [Plutella xylostella]|uniref:Uncharacterized protein n=1 Tax=Plutella xylostella TaxID=51655 RepID=A0ABQ7QA29_PLUXY|nr:hypothetical protein JYU34_013562 [Plutella xylostella]